MANNTATHATVLQTRLLARSQLLALLGRDATHPGVYWDEITPPPKWPAVIYSHVRTGVLVCVGPGRAGLESVWHIKAVVVGRSFAPAAAIMAEVDTALQTPYGMAQSGAITEMHLEQEETLADTDEAGQAYRHLIYRYRAVGPA